MEAILKAILAAPNHSADQKRALVKALLSKSEVQETPLGWTAHLPNWRTLLVSRLPLSCPPTPAHQRDRHVSPQRFPEGQERDVFRCARDWISAPQGSEQDTLTNDIGLLVLRQLAESRPVAFFEYFSAPTLVQMMELGQFRCLTAVIDLSKHMASVQSLSPDTIRAREAADQAVLTGWVRAFAGLPEGEWVGFVSLPSCRLQSSEPQD